MAKDKKSFVVYTSWKIFLEDLTNEQLGTWFRWVLDYCNDNNPEYPDDQAVKIACKMTRDILKRDLEKYEAKVDSINKARENRKINTDIKLKSVSNQLENNTEINNEINTEISPDINTVSSGVICNMLNVKCNNVEDKSSLFIKESTEGAKEKSERFSKPSIEEIEKYIEEQHYSVNAEKFYSYYESNGWKIGKSSMKSWKAALRTWNLNNKEQNKSNSNDLNKKSIEELMKMDINKGTTIL